LLVRNPVPRLIIRHRMFFRFSALALLLPWLTSDVVMQFSIVGDAGRSLQRLDQLRNVVRPMTSS
jgi:hypothetical protein